jgi:hypothetical protein
MRSFHYSAQITADYRKYVHVYGADIDIDEFVRLFWDRRSGSKSKIPKAMEAPFLVPQNDAENRIKESITAFSDEQTAKLEQDLFKQRTRLADAERTLLSKTTKAAAESKRIAADIAPCAQRDRRTRRELQLHVIALLHAAYYHEGKAGLEVSLQCFGPLVRRYLGIARLPARLD